MVYSKGEFSSCLTEERKREGKEGKREGERETYFLQIAQEVEIPNHKKTSSTSENSRQVQHLQDELLPSKTKTQKEKLEKTETIGIFGDRN